MKYCPHCGNELEKTAVFCTNCGGKIGKELGKQPKNNEMPSSFEKVDPTMPVFKKTEPVKPSIKKWIIGGICITALIGGGWLTYAHLSKNNTEVVAKKRKKVQEKKREAMNETFMYRVGDGMGLMNRNFEILTDNIGNWQLARTPIGTTVVGNKDGETSLIDKNGKTITEMGKYKIGLFNSNGGDALDIISKNGVLSIYGDNPDDDEGRDFNGLINAKGEVVSELAEVTYMPFFGREIGAFMNAYDRWGVVNEKGEVLIQPDYERLSVISDRYISVFQGDSDAKSDILDLKGNMVKENIASELVTPDYHQPDKFIFKSGNGKYGILNSQLEVEHEPFSVTIPTYSADGKYISFSAGEDGYGLMSRKGEIIIPAKYKMLLSPNEKGVLAAQDENEQYCLMDVTGKVIKNFDHSIYPLTKTNLFSTGQMGSGLMDIVDSTGKVIEGGEEAYPAVDRRSVDFLMVSNDQKDIKKGSRVYNKDGQKLSDNALIASDLGDVYFIQEWDNTMKLVNKKTSKVIKEKTLDIETPYYDYD